MIRQIEELRTDWIRWTPLSEFLLVEKSNCAKPGPMTVFLPTALMNPTDNPGRAAHG